MHVYCKAKYLTLKSKSFTAAPACVLGYPVSSSFSQTTYPQFFRLFYTIVASLSSSPPLYSDYFNTSKFVIRFEGQVQSDHPSNDKTFLKFHILLTSGIFRGQLIHSS